MEWGLIFQLLSIAITIAVLVILIVVLARNPIKNATHDDALGDDVIALNNKVNWIFALEIAAVGLMLVFAIIGFFMYRRLPVIVC
jgi:uncharacterized membrane protein